MNDLEDRVRSGLRDLAATVPPSENARADFERHRFARWGPRKPVFVVAAAAVAMVAVAVPVVLSQRSDPVATPPATSSSAIPIERAPVVLGRFDENGVGKAALLMVDADGKGWCIAESTPGAAPENDTCWGVPTWSNERVPGTDVLSIGVLGTRELPLNAGPLPDLLLFVTVPQVTKLEVGSGDGAPVTVREVARTAHAGFFLADFDGSTRGLSYTAYDREGNVVESAIE